MATAQLAEHAEAEEVLKAIENTDATDARFDELIGDIRHHLRDEENDLLPKLRAACDAGELRDLGDKVARKKMAPTRPHPAAPDTPLPTRSSARASVSSTACAARSADATPDR